MNHPFQVSLTENVEMGAWELLLQIGDFKTKKDAEEAAKYLSEFVEGETGWKSRVQ